MTTFVSPDAVAVIIAAAEAELRPLRLWLGELRPRHDAPRHLLTASRGRVVAAHRDRVRADPMTAAEHNARAVRRVAAGGFEWNVTPCRCGWPGKRDLGGQRTAERVADEHNEAQR